jgi:hypothetical protein
MSASIAQETEILIDAQRFAQTQHDAALKPLFRELAELYPLLGRLDSLAQAAREAALDRYTEVQVAIHREVAGWGEQAGTVRSILYERLMVTVDSIDLVGRFAALEQPADDVSEAEALVAFLKLQEEAREWWMSYEERRALWQTNLIGLGAQLTEADSARAGQ